jgi:hypothetical protein
VVNVVLHTLAGAVHGRSAMKVYARLLLTMGRVFTTLGVPAAHAAAAHAVMAQTISPSDSGGDRDDTRSRSCGSDKRWGYGDGYSHQNTSDEELCKSYGRGPEEPPKMEAPKK